MQTIQTTQLKDGMVTALPVLTKHGQLIVDAGITLSNPLITRIRFYGIDSIQIHDFVEPEFHIATGVTEPSYSQQIRNSPQFLSFQIAYAESTKALKEIIAAAVPENGSLDTEALYQTVQTLLLKAPTSIEMFDILHNMRTVGDSIYAHSLNVALISGMMGKWLKMPAKDFKVLMLAALLHDIGKTRIPPEVLDKPGKYTDEEFDLVQRHPIFGYNLLLHHEQLDPRIKTAALMHHERCDGKGYPKGLMGEEIDDFAQMIAIADVYDAMTATRSYRAPLCPFQAIADFELGGLQKYNPKFILIFLERIAYTYQNNRVLLTDGREAKIIMLNKQFLSRPVVEVADGTCIDLSRMPYLRIKALA